MDLPSLATSEYYRIDGYSLCLFVGVDSNTVAAVFYQVLHQPLSLRAFLWFTMPLLIAFDESLPSSSPPSPFKYLSLLPAPWAFSLALEDLLHSPTTRTSGSPSQSQLAHCCQWVLSSDATRFSETNNRDPKNRRFWLRSCYRHSSCKWYQILICIRRVINGIFLD